MIPINKISGRLGNQMFELAFCYAHARDNGIELYHQDPQFFDKYKTEIKELFGEGISSVNKVAIHIRRGDYVNNPFYVDLTKTDYYEKAINLFYGERFLIFSDDIEFCKLYFIGDKYEFNEDSEIDALNMMASCKGVICANSSFSWWGGYLSKGKVVAPRLWYSDGIERTKCPQEWTRI